MLGDADDGATAGGVSGLGVAGATTGVLAARLDALIGVEGSDDTGPAGAGADELDPPVDASLVRSEAAGSRRLARHPTTSSNITPHKTRSGSAAI